MNATSPKDMLIAEDALIADVQFAIHNLLSEKGVNRAELAKRMDVSEAYVSQMFKDTTRNLTLKTVARIFCALGEEARITSDTLDRLIPAKSKRESAARPNKKDNEAVLALRRLFGVGTYEHCNDNDYEFDLAA
jgi:transcriptional regulator with XRE-family HTH domain